MYSSGDNPGTQTIANNQALLLAYLLLIALIALVGLVAYYVTAMIFPPIQVLFAGIHELGHAIGTAATGGQVYSININMGWNNNVLSMWNCQVNRSGGEFLIISPAGIVFSLIMAVFFAKAPVLRWYVPVLCMGNLIQMSPTPVTDGGMLISCFGAFGILLYSAVMLIGFALGALALHYFVSENIVTKVIRNRTSWIDYIKDELIKAG